MPLKTPTLLAGLLASASPHALYAQSTPENIRSAKAPPAQDIESEDIVVTGAPERGAVAGDIKPEQQLSPADVRAYGVSSISDLLTELAPQTNASGGTPVVLLNGKRISAFSEIQDIPAEAIMRVDILPEEVSLKYGYAPNQKVVNIVLRQRFRALTGEGRAGTTTQGGRENGTASANLLRIQGDNRFNIDIKYAAADNLLESERTILPTTPSRPYSLAGTVMAAPGSAGTDIDPALSALAGTSVAVAAAPAAAANGTVSLTDFVAGANSTDVSNLNRYRTLSPATENLAVNAVLARALPGGISASLNGRLELSDSDSLQGLSSASLALPVGNPYSPFSNPVQVYRYIEQAGALGQSVRGTTAHAGLTLNGAMKPWQWSFTGTYDLSDTRTRTDRDVNTSGVQAALVAGDPGVNPFGTFAPDLLSTRTIDRAKAKSSAFTGNALLSGPLFSLPAGTATTSIALGGSASDFDSRSVRSGTTQSAEYSRDIANGQLSIDLPITSRRKGPISGIGDVSLNGNFGFQRLSDFGTLTTIGYGLRWTPIAKIRIIASSSNDKSAPTGSQINSPQVVTPNVPVFDYQTGQTVYVSQLGGSNPTLRESKRRVMRLGLTIKPFDKANLTLTANYSRSRTDNPIAAFPTPTPQIEAAFPDRFLRDADGTLVQIDARPINFAQARSSQLRWGFDFSKSLKSNTQKAFEAWRAAGSKPEDRPTDIRALFGPRREGAGSGQPGGESSGDRPREGGDGGGGPGGGGPGGGGPGGGGFGGGPGGGGGGRGGSGGGRLQFALYHTWHFTDTILIGPGIPKLNLLDGDATGSAGGSPRHELEAQAGYNNNGIGVRLSGEWQSATHVDGALGASNTTLRFSSLATANLRLFANLGQMPKLIHAHPFLRGARVSLSVNNLFNSRQSVSDGTGSTPLRYQQDYLDPLGRTVSISFRKLFF
jgi:hypothetical protein